MSAKKKNNIYIYITLGEINRLSFFLHLRYQLNLTYFLSSCSGHSVAPVLVESSTGSKDRAVDTFPKHVEQSYEDCV